jgi:hypothetical protein
MVKAMPLLSTLVASWWSILWWLGLVFGGIRGLMVLRMEFLLFLSIFEIEAHIA